MASIRKIVGKKGTTYKVEVARKGHPRTSANFDRKSDAIRWGEDVEYALLHNMPLPGEELPQDDKSIFGAVEDYLMLMRQDKKRSRNTILTDENTGKRLIDRFGKSSLRKLTREDIEQYRDHRLRSVGTSSVRQDMSMLSAIYRVARVEWRMKDLEYPGKDVKRPGQPKEREAVVPEGKFEILLDECKKAKNDKLYPLVFLLVNTGMRPAEAVLMRWPQVLWEQGVIDLTKTKTDPRRVPLSQSCADMLKSIQRQDGTDLVFVTEETSMKDKPVRFFRRAFEQACIRAEINQPKKRDVSRSKQVDFVQEGDAAPVTLYSLRHSAASYMVMAGVSLETVRDILGHKNISQTSRYTHISDEHKRQAVDNPNLPWKK